MEDTPAQGSTLSQQTMELRSQLGWNIRENLQKLCRKRGCPTRPETLPIPDGIDPTSGPENEGREVHTPLPERPLNIPTAAWLKQFSVLVDLCNSSEGCFDGRLLQANVRASSVMTSVSNLTVITAANYQRNIYVGSMRLMEMLAALG